MSQPANEISEENAKAAAGMEKGDGSQAGNGNPEPQPSVGPETSSEETAKSAAPEKKEDKKGEKEKASAAEKIAAKVLVVEDSLPLRRMLCKILESQQLQCFEAADGEAAMALIKQYAPNFFALILTDLMMPKMDGVEFIANLRKKYGAELPPIMICSSRSDRETVQTVAKLGATGYILKPFKTEMVIQRVRDALAKSGKEKAEQKAESKDKG